MTSNPSTLDKRDCILVLDLGTSGLRTSIYDLRGQRIDDLGDRYSWTLRTTSDGGAELDPGTVFDAVMQGIDEILAQCKSSTWNIVHIASCVLCPTLIGLDNNNNPVTPAYTWADVRAANAAAELKSILNMEEVFQRTGCVLHAAYLPAKIRWLSDSNPSLFSKVARWCGLGDYITLRLYGRPICSLSVASWAGLMNRRLKTWDAQVLSTIGVTEQQLPEINVKGEPIRSLTAEWSNRWPDLRDTNWFHPIGDGVANNLGSGCTSSNRVALMIATSGAVRIISSKTIEKIPKGLWAYCIDQQSTLLGGALSSGGNVIDWLLKSLNIDRASILNDLHDRAPDGHGLTVLPFLAGERNPNWADHARGTIFGLSLSTTPLDIFQASVEAIAYEYAAIYNILREYLGCDPQIIATGGAISHYPFLAQLMADVLGQTVSIIDDPEISSRGVAVSILLTLAPCGQASEIVSCLDADLAKVTMMYEPSADNHKRHQAGKQRHRQLYDKLIS